MNRNPHPSPLPVGEGTFRMSLAMNNTSDEKQTRREICFSAIRYLTLSGLGLLWAGLYVRSARRSVGNSCSQSLSCGGCTLLEQCDLPRAHETINQKKRQ